MIKDFAGGYAFANMQFSKRHIGGLHALTYDAYIRLDRLRGRISGKSIDRSSGIVFVHIPKCAGISLSHALHLQYPGHKLLCDFSREELERAKQIVFCTRDPFDRLVSAFNFHKRLANSKPLLLRKMLGHPRLTTFKEFVHSSALEQLEAYQYFYRSQYQYLKGIERYREKAVHLRFESLAADFERHFGRNLPRMNAGGGPGSSAEFDTPENRARVESVYRADYELLPKLLSKLIAE